MQLIQYSPNVMLVALGISPKRYADYLTKHFIFSFEKGLRGGILISGSRLHCYGAIVCTGLDSNKPQFDTGTLDHWFSSLLLLFSK